ncbi:MAG: hypothetical protein ACR2OV_08595 [Hyphomicrobiaceae bacterium]
MTVAVVAIEARAQVQPAQPDGQSAADAGGAEDATRNADAEKKLKPPKTSKWLDENTWKPPGSSVATSQSYKFVAPQSLPEAVAAPQALRSSVEPRPSAIERVYESIQRERCREAQAATTEALKTNSNLFAQDNPTIFLNFNCK